MIVMRSRYESSYRISLATNGTVARSRALQSRKLQSRTLPMPSDPFLLGSATGRIGLWLVIGLTLIWSALLLTTRPASAQSFQLFVPAITTEGVSSVGEKDEPVECGLNANERAVADLMVAAPEQQRETPVCDPILARVARARARDMALRGYFSHTNPDGDGVNLLAREAGYPLPDWYASNQDSNNIESIGGGYQTSADVWAGWIGSSGHRVHVLGTESFYADQEAYGVGYYFNPDSPLKHYWVFLSAPVAE